MSQSNQYWNDLLAEVFGDISDISSYSSDATPNKVSCEEQLDELVRTVGQDGLVLVLGSGISRNFGLPLWNQLLKDLLNAGLQKKLSEEGFRCEPSDIENLINSPLSPIIIASFIRSLAQERFSQVVWHELYRSPPKWNEKSEEWLSEITALCQSKQVDSIITYNFDDVLEQFFAKNNLDFAIYDINNTDINLAHDVNKLPIYHVHGLLQQHKATTENTKIIFSEENYHEQYHDPYSWNTLIQLDKYRSKPCLFIGTSLTDPNQRRLLELSRKRMVSNSAKHYVFRSRSSLIKSKDATSGQNLLYPMKFMEFFYERLDNDLGINTIWVEDYAEIPKLIKKIREKLEN